MENKFKAFYRSKQTIFFDFSAEPISSDGGILLLEKIERKHKLIKRFASVLPEFREERKVKHSLYKLLKQRVFMLMLGYSDANDVKQLKNDPLLRDVVEGSLASQPTISRFENSLTIKDIIDLTYAWIDNYVASLEGRDEIIIDIDSTDDPTHGNQQLSLFNGYYGHYMYNELFFHDGQTGQIILPVLRPGNSHSNRWYVSILRRIIERIRKRYPDIKITVRADSGFSCPGFYRLARKYNLFYAIGLTSNPRLNKYTEQLASEVVKEYVSKGEKHQSFISFDYQAESWDSPERCYAKVESTGKGLNIRYIVSNLPSEDDSDIYLNFYVKRGESSENRIKEVKNMCFSDRLSNHKFTANYFRLFLSSLAYEMFLLLKLMIKQTKHKQAHKWQIDTIRVLLLKIGSTIRKSIRRVYYSFSKAFVYKDLMIELLRI